MGILNVFIGITSLLVYPLYYSAHQHSFALANVLTTCLEGICVVVPIFFYRKRG